MKLFSAAMLSTALLGATSTAFANCNQGTCPPQSYRGLFVGVGGSYNNIEFDFGLNDERAMRNCGLKFAPVFQAGYLMQFSRCPSVLFGVKAFYKYLDYEQSPHSIYAAQQAVNVQHEYGILGMIARSYCSGISYAGLGAAWSKSGFSYQLTIPYNYRSECDTQAGLALQVGITHNLCHGWFLDFNYTYLHNSHQSVSITPAVTGNYCVKMQEFMLTINKAFFCS